jgi:hypothetical protein
VLLYGRNYEPAFRLIAVHPAGFADFGFLKAKLDRLLERKGPVQLLHWGCPLLYDYARAAASRSCSSPWSRIAAPEPGRSARRRW